MRKLIILAILALSSCKNTEETKPYVVRKVEAVEKWDTVTQRFVTVYVYYVDNDGRFTLGRRLYEIGDTVYVHGTN
jgi:hypothetical protein